MKVFGWILIVSGFMLLALASIGCMLQGAC